MESTTAAKSLFFRNRTAISDQGTPESWSVSNRRAIQSDSARTSAAQCVITSPGKPGRSDSSLPASGLARALISLATSRITGEDRRLRVRALRFGSPPPGDEKCSVKSSKFSGEAPRHS